MNSPLRILLLEGEKADAELIKKELQSLGLSFELRHVRKKEDLFESFESYAPDLVLSNRVTGTLSHILDRTLQGLRKSEEHFRSLIENAGDIILVLNDAGVIGYASPSVTKLLGYETDGFIGQNLLNFIHAEDAENARFILTSDHEKKDLSMEFRFRRKDGSWRGVEAVGKRVDEEDGHYKTIINARDITDRILEQEALRESILRHLKTQTELQKIQHKVIQQERMAAIGQLASGIAHDFSNSLMPVLGFSEILMNRPEVMADAQKVRKYVEMINTSARDAMHIVSGLREFYRQKEKIENLLPMDVNKTIEQAVHLTQPKWREECRAKGVDVRVSLKLESVPEIVGNEGSIREALINLIFNALDAMPKGGLIQFKTRLDGTNLVIEVSDSGAGMDEATRQRCFEPFFSTKGRGGTGLGLSMVYGVVRRHEGTIEINSQPGQGSVFLIRLPIRAAQGFEGRAPEHVLKKIVKKISVLVVDDEAMVRDVLREYLSGDGHEVDTAGDGREALKIFNQKKFDLVITDRAMPEMSGDQLIIEIKKISPKTPLVMLTGFGELMKAKGEHPAGADYLLSKPLTFEAYREVLAKVASSSLHP